MPQFNLHVLTIFYYCRFTEVSGLDEGPYICTAENEAGSIEAVAVLEIVSQPIITLNPRGPLTVYAGQPVRIDCTARGKPAPTVSWINPRVTYG